MAKRKWIEAVVWAIAAPLAALLLIEAGLRLAGYGYPAAFFVRIPSTDSYAPNEKYGWRFFPRAIARTPVPCRLETKKQDTYRIFVIGDSAAMGVPEPAFSFGRMLEAMLRERYPGVHFEVINAAMTAINSHVELDIARDCARRKPDLFLAYLGNNEVVGPYGAGTVFGGYSPSLAWIRASVWVGSTRLGELAQAMARPKLPEWKGMSMFMEHRVEAGDARLRHVYTNFESTLRDLARVAAGAGARILFSTVLTNVKDNAPFASSNGEADRQYRLGRSLLAAGQNNEAARHFRQARDLDELRFRADTRINDIIRQVAGPGLMDPDREYPLVGEEILHEHVHLNFDGNYLLAHAFLRKISNVLPGWVRAREQPGEVVSRERLAALLAFTSWNEYRIAQDIFAATEQPPFTNQSDHAERRAVRLQKLTELERRVDLRQAEEMYRAAVRRVPEDLHFRAQLAELLAARGDPAGAEEQWRALLARVPGVRTWRMSLASALNDRGKLSEAEREYGDILRLNPQFAEAHFGLGTVKEKQGDRAAAARHYRAALELRADYAEAHNNLGLVGDPREAIAQFREALRIRPGYAAAQYNLARALGREGLELANQGRIEDAITRFSEAIRLRPDAAEAHYNLAALLGRRGDAAGAMREYGEALRLRPDYPEAHNNLGNLLARNGHFRQAIDHYSAALRLKPDFEQARANLVKARRALSGPRSP